MDKAHPLSSPMVCQSFEVKYDLFHSHKNDELFGHEVPYFSC